MIKIYGPKDRDGYFKGGVCADPKAGKSRFITSFPAPETMYYVAIDPGSEQLASTLPQYRERITVAKPGMVEKNGRLVFDRKVFCKDLTDLAMSNIRKDTGCDHLILDTMSIAADVFLKKVAQKAHFAGQNGPITEQSAAGDIIVPQEGDYGVAQSEISQLIDAFILQDMNVWMIFHPHHVTDKQGNVLAKGPALVGKALTQRLPGTFNPYFHITRKAKMVDGKSSTVVTVHSEPVSGWPAGFRSAGQDGKNPMPAVDLRPDPGHFWIDFYKNTRGN